MWHAIDQGELAGWLGRTRKCPDAMPGDIEFDPRLGLKPDEALSS
jgi:hypothetical protein